MTWVPRPTPPSRRRSSRPAAADAAPHPHLIGGEQVEEGEVFERRDPARTESVASRAHAAGPELVDRARGVRARGRARLGRDAVRRALPAASAPWPTASARATWSWPALASLETGKSRTESILEVQEAIDLIEAYAGHMEENEGYTQPLNSYVEGERNVDVLRPYGVFGVIAPFNFPVALSVGMFSSALIAGNAVVFKPSEESPSTGAALAEIVVAAGLPAGAFNLVHGGPDTGRALVDAAVDGIAFTGSAEVGREIAQKLQGGPYARPALTEMGGKNPAIVTASADVDAAAEGVARSAFGLSGQKCSACSRAIVDASVHDEFVERLAARAAELRARRPERPRRVRRPGDQRGERGPFRAGGGGGGARGPGGSGRRHAGPAGALRGADGGGRPPARTRARARRAVPAVRDRHARRLVRRGARGGERPRVRAHRRDLHRRRGRRRSASSPRSTRASST